MNSVWLTTNSNQDVGTSTKSRRLPLAMVNGATGPVEVSMCQLVISLCSVVVVEFSNDLLLL